MKNGFLSILVEYIRFFENKMLETLSLEYAFWQKKTGFASANPVTYI